jgi:N-acetylglucosamine-6-phosphate deacetylase
MVSIGDVVNSESPEILRQLAGGLTVANLLHGSANPIGGQNAVIKLRLGQGPEAIKFKAAPPGIKFALGENVKQSNWGDNKNTRFPQTRMGVPAFHENRFTAAWQYNREWRRFHEEGGPPPRRDLELETLGQIIKAERWVHCHSYRQDEILAFMRTMEKFGVRVGTLQHVLEGYKVADEIAAHGAGGSCFADWWAYKYEVIDAIPHAGSLMRERGVLVSFNSDSSDLARRMNLEAAKAVKYGNTSESEALNFVTLNPARQLRVDHRVGSLEVGKDGDFAIWTSHPLSTGAVCLETWIEGKRYFEREATIRLAEARAKEREELLAKAKGNAKKNKKEEKDDDAKDARAAFFRRALETAHGLGVIDCHDCKIETE